MRKTKIICTIGPATETTEMLRELVLGGMNVARLNFSHGTHEQHLEKVVKIKKLREELECPVALLMDTRGPEIRVKTFKENTVELKRGQKFILTTRDIEGDSEVVSVTYEDLPNDLHKGARVLLDDGLIELIVEKIDGTDILCTVNNDGLISNRKSINLPGITTKMPYISEKDEEDLIFAYENDFDYIALSFVRSAQDILKVKNFLANLGPSRCELIAKIENADGVNNIDEIIRASNGIMVARGDMGVEIPFEELPGIQKSLIKKCYRGGKKVITATQMLESMIRNPRPTRAEITDIANAIYDGTSAIMLSGETTVGQYPIECLMTMVKIAEKTEAAIDYEKRFYNYEFDHERNVTNAISHATCTTAHDLDAAAIVTVTLNGSTARMISRFRPEVKIIAVTPKKKTYMQLALSWGVIPLLSEFKDSPDEMFHDAVKLAEAAGLAKDGDLIVTTGSSSSRANVTNTLQVHVLGNILARGIGHSSQTAKSKACLISRNSKDFSFTDGDIVVIDRTTNNALHILRRAKGVITEEDFSESGIAAAAIALDIPVITSAVDATKLITDGGSIYIDTLQGLVYNGEFES
jgi:pyruvate kinase